MVAATSSGVTLCQALSIDAKRGQYEFDFKQRIGAAHALLAAEQTGVISLPTDVPRPTAHCDSLGEVQHKATFDFVSLPLAFTLPHEFRHVMFGADKSAPSTLPEKELAWDIYVRDFMTNGLAACANKHGHTVRADPAEARDGNSACRDDHPYDDADPCALG